MENLWDDIILKLREERCDCVLSIRGGSTCNRCKDLAFYLNLKRKENG